MLLRTICKTGIQAETICCYIHSIKLFTLGKWSEEFKWIYIFNDKVETLSNASILDTLISCEPT